MSHVSTSSRSAGLLRVPRRRGALSGVLLALLGVWGAVIPFVGPYFGYAYTPDRAWTWTSGRLWLEVLPGLATVVGGLLLLRTANRVTGVFGGLLASASGAWFVLGPVFGQLWSGPQGGAGSPVGGPTLRVVEQVGFFYGLGAAIVFLAAHAVGRFGVRSVRDARLGERHRAGVGEGATTERRGADVRERDVRDPGVERP